MIDATPYTVPKEPGRWRAITLAALVHAALLAFLWIGVRWQNEMPATIEAEVWDPQVREAAPRPEPVTEPEPKPEVKEPPKPKVVELEPKVDKPDIALEQEKKRKAREEQKRLEEEERLARQKQKAEEERLAKLKQKADEEKLAKLKKEEEKKQLEKAENAKKLAAEKKRKQDEADEKMLSKMREENLQRMTAGVTGSGGSGDAPKSQGNRGDASYAQRVGAKIKSNINFNAPEDMAGNPAVEYEVNLLPDGSVGGMRMKKSSGVPGFDEAVRRAIEKAQPYPKDKSGAVPSSFIGIHRLKDQ
jgi:colicin import membrane protein